MTAHRRRGLGRGLDSLIPGSTSDADQGGVVQVDIDALEPNPLQPRTQWDEAELDSLAQSIAEHGVIQPLIVTQASGNTPYQIIAGERRWRAARRAGLSSVPALIREVSSRDTLELALVENLQRADLNAIEEALAYRQLIDQFDLTQEAVAKRVGRSRSAVANTLRLLDAPEAVRGAVINEEISAGHARALLAITDPGVQQEALERVKSNQLSVRQTEQHVKRLAERTPRSDQAQVSNQHLNADERAVLERLERQFGTRIELRRTQNGRGRLILHFYSDEQLNEIVARFSDDPGDDL